MPEIYSHMNPIRRITHFARCRIKEINDQIKQLEMERQIMATTAERFEKELCPDCHGDGHIMKLREGDDPQDGPRMHTCESCKGTGYLPENLPKENACEICQGKGWVPRLGSDEKHDCEFCDGTGENQDG